MKYQIVVHHLATGRKWGSTVEEYTLEEYEEAKTLLKEIAASGTYFTFRLLDGGSIVFPKEIIQQCVFMLVPVEE